jgi:hypothetical protein
MSALIGVALAAGMLAAGMLAAGCGDDNNGGISAQVDTAGLRMAATSSSGGQLEFEDPSGTLYTLTSLRVGVEEIELDRPEDVSCGDLGGFSEPLKCDDDGLLGGEDQIRLDGPIVFDVLEGTTTPDISGLEIPAINYQEVDLEVDTARVEDDTIDIEDEMIDRTVVAYADFESDGQKRQLKLDFSFKAEAKAGDPASLALERGDTLVLELDVTNWLRNIPVTRCLQLGELKARGGVVALDDESIGECHDAEADFEENFEQSLEVRIERADQ